MDTPINTRYPQDVLEGMRKLAKAHVRSFNGEVIHALRGYIAQKGKAMRMSEKEAQKLVDKFNQLTVFGAPREEYKEIVETLAADGYGVRKNSETQEYELTEVPDMSMID